MVSLKDRLENYIKDVQRNVSSGKKLDEIKTQDRIILPLINILGWDFPSGTIERKPSFKIARTELIPDFCLIINDKIVAYLEAKSISEDLNKYEKQIVDYMRNGPTKPTFGVLTNGLKLRVYYRELGLDSSKPDRSMLFQLQYDSYLDEIDKLSLLLRASFEDRTSIAAAKSIAEKIKVKNILREKEVEITRGFVNILKRFRVPQKHAADFGSIAMNALLETKELVREKPKHPKISKSDMEEMDTIVVAAKEDGFNEVFIGENCWYAIRISKSMVDKIKYIAGYQSAPISAITYYAEVANIDKYKGTEKYIIYFKDKAKQIGPISLVPKGKVKAPQSPRYTNFEKLSKAKTLDEAL